MLLREADALQREKEELDAQEAALLREAEAMQTEEMVGELDGLAEVLNTARGLQRALVGDFVALCANEALFPRRPRSSSSGSGCGAP